MRTFTNGNLKVVAPDASVWKQMQNVVTIIVTGGNANTIVSMYGDYGNASWRCDAEGKVLVDMSEALRTYGDGTLIFSLGATSIVQIPFDIAGLISPDAEVVPGDDMTAEMYAKLQAVAEALGKSLTNAQIYPPHKMLQPIGTALSFPFYAFATDDALNIDWYNGATLLDSDVVNRSQNEVYSEGVNRYEIHDVDGSILVSATNLVPMECGKRYVSVKWQGAQGGNKIHTFEMRDYAIADKSTTELLTWDDGYKVAKDRVDSASLVITDLTAYDVWYYSDICAASYVEASFDGSNWFGINVTTKSVSVPNGNVKLNDFKVNINLKHYATNL